MPMITEKRTVTVEEARSHRERPQHFEKRDLQVLPASMSCGPNLWRNSFRCPEAHVPSAAATEFAF